MEDCHLKVSFVFCLVCLFFLFLCTTSSFVTVLLLLLFFLLSKASLLYKILLSLGPGALQDFWIHVFLKKIVGNVALKVTQVFEKLVTQEKKTKL